MSQKPYPWGGGSPGEQEAGGDAGYGRREKKGREGGSRDLYYGGKRERNSKRQAVFLLALYFVGKNCNEMVVRSLQFYS